MYEQGRRPSDSATASSETSNVTSRATTISDSNGDRTLQQQMNPSNIQPKEDERSSISLTTLESVGTVANKKTDIQTTNNNQSDQINTRNQQQQPWVNPYWGSNWKPGATTAQSGTNNNNTNIKQISLATPVQQLIPGSILINDRGEIKDSAWKQNIRFDSSTSNNLFNPGGKHISNGSGGPNGYLVPTHIRRQIVTSSSPGLNIHPEKQLGYKRSSSSSDAGTSNRPEFTRQQTFPQRTDHDIQPWVNPYWSKPNQINSQFTQNNNTNQNKNPQSTLSTNTRENPYWKDRKPQTSIIPQQQGQPWENPYWKDKKPQTSNTSQQQGQPWENPYWKDKKPQTSTTSQQQGQQWENPYWKDKKPQTSTTSQQQGQPWQNPYWKNWKPQTPTTSKQQGPSWENPYWKDKKPQTSTTSQQQGQSWENPYWKDKKPQTSTTSQQQGQPWQNPYWKDKNPQTPTTSQQQGQPWQNPYWKDKKPQTSTTPQQQGQPWQNPYWKDWKPQTSTTSKQQGQPWENPYWKNRKPQTSTTSQQQIQPWKNPYWKDKKPQTSITSQQQGQQWGNPYWKDKKPQTSTTFQQRDQSWENPYWKDWKPQTSTTSKQQSQPWENPYWKSQTSITSKSKDPTWKNSYWKDWELQGSTTSNQQQDKPWKNSYWKDKNTSNQGTNGAELNKPLSFESKTLAIPPFYERIYPPETVLSSSSERPKPMINDNDDLTFTIDKQGVAHYQAASSSPSGTNKTVNFASEPTVSQHPISSRSPPSVASTSRTLNATSSSKTANTASPPSFSKLSNYPPSSFDYSSSTSSSNVLTEEDVNNIQHALHSFATNSNSIPVIETSNEVPSSNIDHQNNSSSFSSSLFTSNQQQKSYQQPPSSPSPLASLFTSNRGQQSNQQRPLSSSSSSESVSQNIQFNSLPYAYNSTSPKSTILSTPSYPSNSNEPLHRLIPKGPIVLI